MWNLNRQIEIICKWSNDQLLSANYSVHNFIVSRSFQNVEKRFLFGYWHCLFPTDVVLPTTISLLNCAVRDSNQRCRMTALQAISLIVYGTKPFLLQADGTGKTPSTFMPFSVALADRIRIMYAMLTQALANESSLPVLTQILKCLAVLIQATSFNKFKQPTGMVTEFVIYIRRLVHHKGNGSCVTDSLLFS